MILYRFIFRKKHHLFLTVKYCAKILHLKIYAILVPGRNVKQNKEEGKDQESIQSSTTPYPGHHMGNDKNTRKKSHTREPKGKLFPQQVTTKIVSMIRKYHNHKLQTNPWHREEEPHNSHETP